MPESMRLCVILRMLFTFTARHLSEPRGKAHPVTVRHPEVLRHLWPGTDVGIWSWGTGRGGRSATHRFRREGRAPRAGSGVTSVMRRVEASAPAARHESRQEHQPCTALSPATSD